VLDRFPGGSAGIAAVGLCGIRFCRALLDPDGRLVEPVLSWMDERVGRPHDPADPRVAHVTTTSGYLTHRLTGRFVDSGAGYQGLWPIDQRTARWSADPAAYEATGLSRHLLADLVSPGGLLGTVTPAAAAATGIPAGLPVHATANDKAVEALGSGLRADDTVLISLGTYVAAMTTGTSPDARADGYWVNFGATPGGYLYESHGIRRGMWTVSWFRDLVSGPGGTAAGDRSRSVEGTLDVAAALVPPGSGGLVALLDWLPPAEAPYRRGALLGFDGSQGRGHVHRSILEGVALTMLGHVRRMERDLGRRFGKVLVAGGGARSDLLVQILADVFERPVRRTAMPDAAGLGAAICACVGAGLHPDWDTATAAMVRPGPELAPDPARAAAYRDLARTYSCLHELTDPVFRWTGRGTAGAP
jgi:sugar (pentulose or hexulose) kinase